MANGGNSMEGGFGVEIAFTIMQWMVCMTLELLNSTKQGSVPLLSIFSLSD